MLTRAPCERSPSALRGCLHEEIVAVTMRTGSLLVLVFWMAVCPAWCQPSNTTEEVRKATIWQPCCARDVISRRSISPTHQRGIARAIVESIAQRKDIDGASRQDFLTTAHRGLDNPKGMPTPNLAEFQVLYLKLAQVDRVSEGGDLLNSALV
jgi:hypothetical protein